MCTSMKKQLEDLGRNGKPAGNATAPNAKLFPSQCIAAAWLSELEASSLLPECLASTTGLLLAPSRTLPSTLPSTLQDQNSGETKAGVWSDARLATGFATALLTLQPTEVASQTVIRLWGTRCL